MGRHSINPDNQSVSQFTPRHDTSGSFLLRNGSGHGLGGAAQRSTAPRDTSPRGLPSQHNPQLARRVLAAALAIIGIATVVALALLWPSGPAPKPKPGFLDSQSAAAETVTGTVIEHKSGTCSSPDVGRVFSGSPRLLPSSAPASLPTTPATPGAPAASSPNPPECQLSVIELSSGPDAGKNTLLETSGMPGEVELSAGENIVLAIHRPTPDAAPQPGATMASTSSNTYTFQDMDRSVSIWLWLGAAVILIIVVGMTRGMLSLIGLGITLAAVLGFLVPGLLRGGDPVALAITAGAAVLFPVLFLVHGVNWKSASALAGTLTTMVLAALLANIAISTSQLRGLGNEDNLLIQLYLPEVSVTGLLMAGFIVGALGVLNDVTIAQASTVQELYDAAPHARPTEVFRSAMRVGRDHIASMVYTLVLAYLGTALPLSILLSVSNRPLMQSLTSDVVATEMLRSVIGAIALVLAVPITTFIAAYTVAPEEPHALERSGDMERSGVTGNN